MAAPRPAKDLKPTDLRAKILQEAKTKKTKAVAEEMRKKGRAQAADKKVRPAKDITKDSARAKFLKDAKAGNIKAKPPTIKPGLGGLARAGAARLTGVAGFLLDPSFFDYKGGGKAGEGSDKPTGPLMKGGKQPGYTYLEDKKAMPAKVLAPARGGGPEKRQGSSAPSMSRAGGGPEKRQGGSAPSVASPAAPKKAEPKKEAKKAVEKKTFAKKVEAPAKPTFRGNWTGAAPTAMQARLGRKISGRRTFGRDR